MSSKSEEPPKQYTRDEYIFLSKLYWKAELFKEMIKFIKEFIILDPKLNKEERDIICTGFKDMISDKRSSWSILNSMERKEKKKKINTVKEIKIVKNNIEKEIREICNTSIEVEYFADCSSRDFRALSTDSFNKRFSFSSAPQRREVITKEIRINSSRTTAVLIAAIRVTSKYVCIKSLYVINLYLTVI